MCFFLQTIPKYYINGSIQESYQNEIFLQPKRFVTNFLQQYFVNSLSNKRLKFQEQGSKANLEYLKRAFLKKIAKTLIKEDSKMIRPRLDVSYLTDVWLMKNPIRKQINVKDEVVVSINYNNINSSINDIINQFFTKFLQTYQIQKLQQRLINDLNKSLKLSNLFKNCLNTKKSGQIRFKIINKIAASSLYQNVIFNILIDPFKVILCSYRCNIFQNKVLNKTYMKKLQYYQYIIIEANLIIFLQALKKYPSSKCYQLN
ncbi:unnamed protein product [Paramecium octaurelia]|uniref:Uncharacterized protein n=1 Tax=Paramecium octaurelia TaxID=43137 RepID=A0A8S1YN69_PAROT|nr:unnamed protein product [Paramecium octaurelia]